MVNLDSEIRRLIELMPASGRMLTKIVSKPDQRKVIYAETPLPWRPNRSILINFNLWGDLTRPQRDMVLLRMVSWLIGVRWLKPDLYQGLTAVGLIGTVFELSQVDVVGAVTAGSLTALAGAQLFRSQRGPQRELEADEAAIRTAQRRGYSETEAARHLLSAIEAIATLEMRSGLEFVELLRCQNLKAIAGLSAIEVPQTLRKE
jgi:hypothetical protein